ncbi:MAG: glycerate kinase [Candidatus Helarchaeota archaeon]|nr:glycerate kinase [Candidatus Helarchaeota archaeon]
MKILLAPDSFKGSATSKEVVSAMEEGIKQMIPEAEIMKAPLSDGGEGMSLILTEKLGGILKKAMVKGPLGDEISSYYGLVDGGRTAVMDVASVIGLPLIPEERRNPLKTSTEGVGELISEIWNEGVERIIIGLGGSSTVDGGTGMAQKLGVIFYSGEKKLERMCGGVLNEITKIDISFLHSKVKKTKFIGACDVVNPLLGKHGAAAVYGPQKGASPEQVIFLEKGLANLSLRMKEFLGKDVSEIKGSGAAGGLGAGLVAFLEAELCSGIELVMEKLGVEEMVKNADIIFSGEGKIDSQTSSGKAVAGVLKLALKYNKPAVLIGGIIDPALAKSGIKGVLEMESLVSESISVKEAMKNTRKLISLSAKKLISQFIEC